MYYGSSEAQDASGGKSSALWGWKSLYRRDKAAETLSFWAPAASRGRSIVSQMCVQCTPLHSSVICLHLGAQEFQPSGSLGSRLHTDEL